LKSARNGQEKGCQRGEGAGKSGKGMKRGETNKRDKEKKENCISIPER
jgi:hypothetical protein